MGGTAVADQQRVALRMVARVLRPLRHAHQSAVCLLAVSRRDALGHDRAAGIAPEVDHLGPGIRLLVTLGHRDRIELTDRIVATQQAARVLPRDRRTCLDLGPRNLRARTPAVATLGHEIVDTALALRIAGIPVLHRRILDLRVLHRDQLDHRRVQLVLVALRRGATLQVADVAALLGDDQGTLELPGVLCIDTEIGRQLHRATHALGDVHEGAVGKHRGIQRRVEVVRVRDHRTEILAQQRRMLARRLRDRAEDHPGVGQVLAEGCRHRDTVEHRIHGDTRQRLLLLQRDAEFLVGAQQLRIHLVEALEDRFLFRRREIRDRLEVDLRMMHRRPFRRRHTQPVPKRLQAVFEHPLGFLFTLRDEADDIFVEARRDDVGLDVGHEAVLVAAFDQCVYLFCCRAHGLFNSLVICSGIVGAPQRISSCQT